MNTHELNSLVVSHTSGTTFYIMQADLPSAKTEKMFSDFFPERRLDLTMVSTTITENEIIVRGTLQQAFLGITNLRAELFFTIVNDKPELKVRFNNFPETWRMEHCFPEFQRSLLAEFNYFQPVFILDSQNRDPLPEDFQLEWGYKPDPDLHELHIYRGLSFEATLAVRDLPGTFSWLAAASNLESLTISGAIEIKNNVPKLWLKTTNQWNFGLADKQIPLQLELVSLLPGNDAFRDNSIPLIFGRLSTWMEATLNEMPFPIPLTATFGSMQTLFINLESDLRNNKQPLLLSDLAGIIGLQAPENLFPKNFPALSGLSLEKIGFDFITSPKKLAAAYALIGSDTTLSFFSDKLKLADLRALFTLKFRDNNDVFPSLIIMLKASFSGKTMEGYLSLPDYQIGCYLPEGETIELKPLAENIIGMAPDIVNAVCTDFNFSANITTQTFRVYGSIDQNWAINLGQETVEFKKLQFDFQHTTQETNDPVNSGVKIRTAQNTGRIYGELQIGEILFYASASLQSAEEGWVFEGGNYEGGIPVTKLVNSLGNAFGVSAEFPIPDFSIYNLNLRFEKNTKNFSVNAFVKTDEPVTIGPAVFDVITFIDLQSKKDVAKNKNVIAGKIECRITIGEALFTVSYAIGNSKLLSGAWQTTDGEKLSLGDLVSLFGIDALPELPVDVHFSKASFTYSSDKKEFTLAAVSDEFGDASLRAFQDQNKKWCFEFSMKLGDIRNLPAIGNQLEPVGDLVKEVSLQVNSPAGSKPYNIALGVGIGLPEAMNTLFGTDANGKPLRRIIKTYDPQNPGYTIIDTRFTRNETGTKLQLLDSPLQSIAAETQNGKTWIPFDFGDCGAGRIEMPAFSYNEAARSFSASGGFEITRTLAVPLGLLRNLLQACGLDFLKNALPANIPLRDINLVDASGNFRFSELNVPKVVSDALAVINSRTNKLPDRFKSYFNIVIPKALSFEIAYGQGLSNLMLRLAVPDANAPVRLLLFAGGGFFGLEIKSILVGEAVRGKMMVIEADAKVDFFDIPTLLAAALIPTDLGGMLPKTADLHKTIVVNKLLSVIPLGAGTPTPVPVFYDELSLNYLGFEGFQARSEFRFPKPPGGMNGLAAVFEKLGDFFTKRETLLDPKKSPFASPMQFTIGAQFVKLPKYMSGFTLGTTADLISVSLYENLAHGLNWLKTFRIGHFIQSIPIEKRAGDFGFSFSFVSYNVKWLASTGKELKAGANSRISITAGERDNFLARLSAMQAAADDALVVFLKGEANLGFMKLQALHGMQAAPSGSFASAFSYAGSFIDFLKITFSGNVAIDPRAKTGEWLKLGGAADIKIGETSVITGTFAVTPASFDVSAAVSLFPSDSPVKMTGNANGGLSKSEFKLLGDVSLQIGGVKLFNGALSITAAGFIISATWLMQQQQFMISEKSGFPVITNRRSFSVELDLDIIELGSILDKIPGLSGKVNLSKIKTAVTMDTSISKNGFSSDVSGSFVFAGKNLSFSSFTLTVSPSSIEEVAEEVARRVAAVIEDMALDFAALIGYAADQIVNAAEETADFAVDAANAAYREGERLVEGAEVAGRATIDAARVAANAVNNTAQDVANEIVNTGKEITRVKGLATTIGNTTFNTISSGIGTISNTFSGIGKSVVSIGKSAWSAVSNFFSGWF